MDGLVSSEEAPCPWLVSWVPELHLRCAFVLQQPQPRPWGNFRVTRVPLIARYTGLVYKFRIPDIRLAVASNIGKYDW